jgi:hypothetical protein
VPGWEVDRGAGSGTHFNGEATPELGEEVPSGAGCMLARFLATESKSVYEGLKDFWETRDLW